MSRPRTYSDAELREAVSASRSWRGTLRHLGLTATSAAAIRSIRRRADELALDHTHFVGQRRWTDDELAVAVSESRTWQEVSRVLGLAEGRVLRGHAARLALDTTHLDPPPSHREPSVSLAPDRAHLGRAAPMMAAAWFTVCGHDVSWPLEPCRYDLLVDLDGAIRRVQVKSTTVRTGASWTVWLSTTRHGRTTYDVDEVDFFFVVDGELGCYLIPSTVVGGLHAIRLSAYDDYRVRAAAWSA